MIMGPGKSGTTALAYRVQACASQHYAVQLPMLFEPKTAEQIENFKHDSGVVKMLLERYIIEPDNSFLHRFSKRVFIYRDPRDNVISRLLWHIGTRLASLDPETAGLIVNAFKDKEQRADSVSVLELFRLAQKYVFKRTSEDKFSYAYGAKKKAYLSHRFHGRRALGFYDFRYEDMIDENMAALEAYLEFPLPQFAGNKKSAQLRRAASYGTWKQWFLDEDCEFFVDRRRLSQMGYDPDERPSPTRYIDPSESSGYLSRLWSDAAQKAAPRLSRV